MAIRPVIQFDSCTRKQEKFTRNVTLSSTKYSVRADSCNNNDTVMVKEHHCSIYWISPAPHAVASRAATTTTFAKLLFFQVGPSSVKCGILNIGITIESQNHNWVSLSWSQANLQSMQFLQIRAPLIAIPPTFQHIPTSREQLWHFLEGKILKSV